MAASSEAPMAKAKQAQQFHDYFQKQSAVIEKDINQLKDIAVAGGERADAIDHCLASIAKLSGDVKDAVVYIPPYDQKTYSDALKALSATFDATRAAVAPRAKFSFKSGRKNASAVSINDALKLESSGHDKLSSESAGAAGSSLSSTTPSAVASPGTSTPESDVHSKVNATTNLDSDSNDATSDRVGVQIRDCTNACRIVEPLSDNTQSPTAVVRNIQRSFVDLTRRPSSEHTDKRSTPCPYASVTLNDISDSWIITGPIAGPIHLTNVKRSILFISCRQYRMHESSAVRVYLSSASRPIIEDCSDVVFAPLPAVFARDDKSGQICEAGRNLWDQVDDFKWLKAGPSPHYRLERDQAEESSAGASQEGLKPEAMASLYGLGPSGTKYTTFDEVLAAVE